MKSYIFAASDVTCTDASTSLDALTQSCEELFPVVLESQNELEILLKLLGLSDWEQVHLTGKDFSEAFDYSTLHLPRLGESDFELFYQKWLGLSGRESSMDEYGQLLFLRSCASAWNQKKHRFVLCEKP